VTRRKSIRQHSAGSLRLSFPTPRKGSILIGSSSPGASGFREPGRQPLSADQSTTMADPNSSNHWDSLASDLGVEVANEEAAKQQPATASSQPLPTPKPPRTSPRAPAPSANWDALASNLGLAPAPEPVAPTKSAAVSPPPASTPPPAAAKPDRRDVPPPQTAEESPNFFDERFDFEEPFDLLEPSEAAPPPAPAAETKEPVEQRPRKRHRRRRSGRESEHKDTREPTAGDVAESPAPQAAPSADESATVSTIVAAEGIGVEDIKTESTEAAERHSKHRRSRRGRKKRPGDESKPRAAANAAGDDSDAEAVADEAVHARATTTRDEDTFRRDRDEPEEGVADEVDEDLSDGDRPARAGFRGIPTWDEAVGLVIAKNMESRSKRPSGGSGGGGSHQGRGGARTSRGSRDTRGGRGGRRRS
jgi:hypothetical protein